MRTIMLVIATLTLAAPLGAQGRGRNTNGVPPGFRPPSGLCRVWIDGVPPGHQPGVTSCGAALATVPSNGRVIFGDQLTASRYTHRQISVRAGTIITRRLYNDDGDFVLQRLRGNANGTYTVLSSTVIDRAPRGDGGGHGQGKNK
jgi:hypothetical protein